MRTSVIKPVLYAAGAVLAGLLSLAPVFAQTDTAAQGREFIDRAIVNAGGDLWGGIATVVVHESQARNTGNGVLQIEIDHTMDTKGRGYRMEVSSTEGRKIYGWDGKQFWASIDGTPGDEAAQKEAKRQISDAFYRFSMPFILANRNSTIEYAGRDEVDGRATNVVKITYPGGPVDGYWKTADQLAREHGHGQHGDPDTSTQAKTGNHGAHHDGPQIYFFHFDEDDRIVKIYFSHHGDDSYETFLFSDFTTIDGITREQSRRLIHGDGKTLYDTRFTRVEFKTDSNTDLYISPHH